MKKEFIIPILAENLLKEAEKKHQFVYICGMCGYGKTTLVREYLGNSTYSYFDMYDDPSAILKFNAKKKTTVVIDNLSFLNDNTTQKKILEILLNPLCWCILISRANRPEWLVTPSSSLGDGVTICDKDLAFSSDETKCLLTNNGVTNISNDTLEKIHERSLGHPLYITYIANSLKQSLDNDNCNTFRFNNTIMEEARQMFSNYLDHALLDRWSDELISFSIMMSVVPTFSIPLAVEITNINSIERLIDEANRVGSFLSYRDDAYSIVNPLRRYLNSKMYSLYSKEKITDIYNTAGHYFKRHNRILDAYEMFKKANNKSGQLDILIDNARRNPSDGFLTELKAEYLALDEATITQSPELISAVCMLYSLMLDVDNSEYWYEMLKEYSKTQSGRQQKIAKRYLTYLDIACIHKPCKNVLPILKNLALGVLDKRITVPEWALTCNGPTLMNGGRDFCEWSKKDTEIYASMEGPFRKIFGKSSAGMPDLSLAESFLEKGESDYEIMRLLSRGQMDADMRGRVELSFVAVGILSQLHLVHGHADDAINALMKFKNNHLDANPKLLANVDALICRINLVTNNLDAINAWLANAPDENDEFNVLYRYIYMCKIRCYLATDNTTDAYTLLNKMMYYADVCERTFIKMECLILMSILEYRNKIPGWDARLCSALSQGEEYHFIRIFSRESAAIYEMLQKCSYKFSDIEYKNQLFAETANLSEIYPSYLSSNLVEDTDISGNALKILQLQADGLSNEEIASTLFISKNTVKYHCKENYRKLNVNDKFSAIAKAKKRGLI